MARRSDCCASPRAECNDSGHGRQAHAPLHPDCPDQGLRRAGHYLVYQLRQPQRPGAGGQSLGRATVPLGRTGACGAHRRPGRQSRRSRKRRLLRQPPAGFQNRRLGQPTKPGHFQPCATDRQRRPLWQPLPAPPAAPTALGGYRLQPDNWEFWQGRKSRLHDRLRYRLDSDRLWIRERLAP